MHCWVGERSGLLGGRGLYVLLARYERSWAMDALLGGREKAVLLGRTEVDDGCAANIFPYMILSSFGDGLTT